MQYLYFRFYIDFKRVKTNTNPAFNAILGFSMFQMMNLASLYILYKYLTKSSFVSISENIYEDSKMFALIFGGLLLGFNYIFLYKKRDLIFKKYDDESIEKRKQGFIVLLLYCIISFVITFILGKTLM